MEANSEPKRKRSFRELVDQIESAENPDWEVFRLSLDGARNKDPELPDVLRACAIPRRFDRRIIGVLRDQSNDAERNRLLLDAVCAHSFVSQREDGSHVYRDAIREAVLEDWRSTAEKQALFVQINHRLAEFHEGDHARARQDEEDLGRASAVMRQANIARYRKLADVVERRLRLPLLEALYHRLLASTEQGFKSFRDWFHQQEAAGRLMVCQALISATRDFLIRLPPDQQDPQHAAWLDYFEARILRQLSPFDFQRAEEVLNRLSARKDLEAQWRFWVLNDLAIVQEAELKLREVVNTRKELLALAEESAEDVYNLPIYYCNLGDSYWTLGELDRAMAYYRTAIEKSETRAGARKDTRVYGRLALSGVHCEAGQWDEGIEVGFEAFYLARTEFADNQAAQNAVANRLMYLLSAFDQGAADAAAAEYLSVGQGGEQSELAALERYIAALDGSGRTGFAEVHLLRLRAKTEQSEQPQLFRPQLLLREGLVRESRSRHEDAIRKYSELVGLGESGQVDNWTRAAALSNRGRLLTIQGSWESAETDLQAAVRLWQGYSHETLIALMGVNLAELQRSRGWLSQAQAELDKAARVLLAGIRSYVGDFHSVQGEVYLSQGRCKEARNHFGRALEISAARRERRSAFKALLKMGIAAAEEGDWPSAAEFAGRAGQEAHALAVRDAYRPSASDAAANRKNAEGLRLFCEGSHLTQACELFRSALDDVPSNFWYRLNLAFASARIENWLDASQAMEKALAKAPAPLRTARLYRCWRDYLLEYAESNYRKADYGPAVQVVHDALGALEPFLPAADLVPLRIKQGDYLWSAGRSQEARQAYAMGARDAESLGLVRERLRFAIRGAFLDAADGRLLEALAGIKAHLAGFDREAGPSLSDACTEAAELIRSPRQFHGAVEFMRALSAAGGIGPAAVEIVNAQLLDVTERSYRAVVFSLSRSKARSDNLLQPITVPIALELSPSLAPAEDSPGIQGMLKQGMPNLRDRVLRDMGVHVPGVRIRTNENNPPGGYFHSVCDTPLYLYTVQEGKRFCPEAERCRSLGLSGPEALNYGPSGGNGLWLDEPQWAPAERAGLPLWDPYEYMTSHTESVIRAHLVSFFGVQELHQIIDEWVEGAAPFEELAQDQRESRQRLRDAAVCDERAFQRLLRVLQALLRENVSILRLERILTVLAADCEGGERDVGEIVAQARMAVREDLPGNKDRRALIHLPDKLADAIVAGVHRQDGKVFLALPPEQVQTFLGEVRRVLAENPGTKRALVVSRTEVRPLVSAITALEFPDIPVLAKGELVAAERKEQA